ncbi:MAG: lipoyl(octanoyl) transferase LipB [Candidatus Omnitrophica bacterium]|nr:lipoyl(octanoyl) transferase LipB [Candidatus Omnitrophota bacterium]
MDCKIFDLGLIQFKPAWYFQKEAFKAVKHGYIDSALIICQHYPVITLGRCANRDNILCSNKVLAFKGIGVFEIERGGDVTYHGPGQLTIYPIFNLNYLKKDIHWYLRQLEEITINFLKDFGITSERRPGLTGVWVGNKKIASIGITVKNWITYHGVSINIESEDLANFKLITPCGLDIEMTCLEKELGRHIAITDLKNDLIRRFGGRLSFGSKDASALGVKTAPLMEEARR